MSCGLVEIRSVSLLCFFGEQWLGAGTRLYVIQFTDGRGRKRLYVRTRFSTLS